MLRNQWVPVRPDAWNDKADCTVSVALGHGNKEQQLMHLSSMLNFAGEAMKGGLKIVTEKNMYNLGAALIRNMGFQNVNDFLTDPSQAPPQQPNQQQQMQMQMAQQKMQIEAKELEIKAFEVQIKAQKVQQEAQEAAVDAHLKMEELQLEREQKRAVAIGAT